MQEHTAALDTKAAVLQVICPIISYEEATYTISAVPSEAFPALLRWRGFCGRCLLLQETTVIRPRDGPKKHAFPYVSTPYLVLNIRVLAIYQAPNYVGLENI